MNCDDFKDLLDGYVEQRLDVTELALLRDHVASCEVCSKLWRAEHSLDSALASLPSCSPSAKLDGAVLDAVPAAAVPVTPPASATSYPPVMTVEEVARYLRLEDGQLGDYLDELPHFELGGRLLVRREALEEWIRRREQQCAWTGVGCPDRGTEW